MPSPLLPRELLKALRKNPHDALFKFIMSKPQALIPYLKSQLPPQVVKKCDWRTIKVTSSSYVDEKLKDSASDLLISIRLKKGHGNREIKVYCLFEHQSTLDPLMPFRILKYIVQIYGDIISKREGQKEQILPLPTIYPLILYNGAEEWRAETTFSSLIDIIEGCEAFVPHFQFNLMDLIRRSDEVPEQFASNRLLLQFLLLFIYGRSERFFQVIEDKEWNVLYQKTPLVIRAFFVYVVNMQSKNPRIKKEVDDLLDKITQKKEVFMPLIELYEEEWREMVRKEGRKEGEREKQIAIARNMLSMKLPLQTISQATGLSIDEVKALQDT